MSFRDRTNCDLVQKDSDLFAERIRAREELRILMNAFAEPLDRLTLILINDQINQSYLSEVDETIEEILQELTRKDKEYKNFMDYLPLKYHHSR